MVSYCNYQSLTQRRVNFTGSNGQCAYQFYVLGAASPFSEQYFVESSNLFDADCKCINYIKITMAVDGRTQSLSGKVVATVHIGDDEVVLHVAGGAVSPGTESVGSRNK